MSLTGVPLASRTAAVRCAGHVLMWVFDAVRAQSLACVLGLATSGGL